MTGHGEGTRGPEPSTEGRQAAAAAGRRVHIDGDATAPVVVGHHNLVVDAQHGSRVTVLVGPERPRPTRRPEVVLLPRRRPAPIGREAELAALRAALSAGGPVQLWGEVGVGKTTLLRHAAHSLPPGPDGVVFLDASGREAADIAQELFEACYEAPGYAPTRAELRRLMAGVRTTVYVDHAELPPEQLPELLDAAPDATFVLAGGTRTLWGDGTALRLTGLGQDAALRLLERELGRPVPEHERATAQALWSAAAGLPLPLLRAAALAVLDRQRAGALPRPGEVAELVPLLLDRLAGDRAALDTLHLLVTLDGAELAPEHIGALAAPEEPVAVCERLVELGLLLAGEHGYRSTGDCGAALRARFPAPFAPHRLCAHLTQWLRRATTTPEQVAAHGPVLDRVAALAEQAGRPADAVRLTREASAAMARSLRFGAWGRLLARGWAAARGAGDRRAEAFFVHEEAVRAVLIGKRVVAAALLAESSWLLHELTRRGGEGSGHAAGPHVATGFPVGNGPTGGAAGGTPPGEGPLGEGPLGAAPPGQAGGGPGTAEPGGSTREVGQDAAWTDLDWATGLGLAPPAQPPQPPGDFDLAAYMAQQLPSPPPAPAAPPVPPAVPAPAAPPPAPPTSPGPRAAGRTDAHGGAPGPSGGLPAGQGAGTPGDSAGEVASAGATSGLLGMGAGVASLVLGEVLALVLAAVIAALTLNTGAGGDSADAPGIEGDWVDAQGNRVLFVAGTGGNRYRAETPGTGCGPVSIQLTRSGDEYHGSQPWYDLATCQSLGEGRLTARLSGDGQLLHMHAESPEGRAPCTLDCDVTLTRGDR